MTLITSYGFGYPFGSGTTFAAEGNATNPNRPAGHRAEVDRPASWSVVTAVSNVCGVDKAPPPTPALYWQMRRYSACALAYAVAAGPVFAAARTAVIRNAEEEGETVPTGAGVQVMQTQHQKWRKATEDAFEPHWPDILESGLEFLNFGHSLQEVAWDRRPDLPDLTVPVRFKPFLPGEATLLRDRYNDFAGFKFRNQERDARYAFLSVCCPHFDPLFGVPYAYNALEAWWRSVRCQDKADAIQDKASGRQMFFKVLGGSTFTDANDKPVLSAAAMQTILDAATAGESWTAPMVPWTKKSIEANPDLAKIPLIDVQSFDWGDTGPALLAAIARLDRLDKEIMRCWRQPERGAMEGQYGTKAEAGTHGQVGVRDSEHIHGVLLRQLNRQPVNRFLVTNFGPEAADAIYFKPAPLVDAAKEFKQQVAAALMTEPDTSAHVDRRRLLKETQIPTVTEEQAKANADAARERQEQRAKERVNGSGVGGRLAGTNGGGRVAGASNGRE